MYRLRRLYLDSIGVADNRFSDITVELTGVDGAPADSIVWLRNGAGKTTMLSLLLALILPDRRDFLATRIKGRTLEDLVLGSDTAHVCAEWVDPNGQVLLTGAIYEWAGRVRPRDYNTGGRDRLNKAWYCVSPEESLFGSTFDELPFTTRSARGGHPIDLDGFKAHIRLLATRGLSATVADKTIAEWHEALRERHFDPEMYKYFAEVNATEGGMDDLFKKIDTAGAFVRYLLRFVADDTRVRPVRDLLADTAVEIAKGPAYLAERDFCAEATPRVRAFGDAHAKVIEAASARDWKRAEASGFKRALLDAAEAVERTREHAEAHLVELHDAFERARNAALLARRNRDEYYRLGAELRLAAAREALRGAEAAVADAKVRAAAWAAVPELAAVTGAREQLRIRDTEMRAAAEESAPLIDRLDRARAVLAGALDAALAGASSGLATLEAEAGELDAARSRAETARQNADGELGRVDADVANLSQQIAVHDAAVARLVDADIIDPGEDLAAAARRLRDIESVAGERLIEVAAERAELEDHLGECRRELKARRDDQAGAARAHAVEAERLAGFERRADALGNQVRVRELLQDSDPDVFSSYFDLLAALDAALVATDAEVLSERLGIAADEQASHALATEGLLPPRAAVAAVVERLDAAGITAHPGWRYLAENYPDVSTHPGLIAALPEICDGVIVYGDLARAAAELDGVELADAVVLSSARAFAEPGAAKIVVGPVAARHDRDAGAAAAGLLGPRIDASRARAGSLIARRQADAALAGTMRALLDELPDGGIVVLRATVTAAADVAKATDGKVIDAEIQTRELEGSQLQLEEARSEAQREQEQAASAAARVEELEEAEKATVAPARAAWEALPARRQRAEAARAAAQREFTRADEALTRCRSRVTELGLKQSDWLRRRAGLPEGADLGSVTIEAAEVAIKEHERMLREAYPEDELRRRVDQASEALQDAEVVWTSRPFEVRALAEEFAVTPAGVDVDLRAGELTRAEEDATAASERLGEARVELKSAEAELAERTPSDRLRHSSEELETPRDLAHSIEMAEAAEALGAEWQLRAGDAERQAGEVDKDIRAGRVRSGLLRDQADKVHSVEPGDVAAGRVPDGDDEVRSAAGAVVAGLEAAEGAYSSAASMRSVRADDLRSWANQDRFARVADDGNGDAVRMLRERLRAQNLVDTVAPQADAWVSDLAVRHAAIEAQLSQVEQTKQNLVGRLGALVEDHLSVISRASALSELPDGIGPWAGARFLDVAPRSRPNREQITVRVAGLVDRMVSAGRVELDGPELLWQATDAAVEGGFKATILKPAPEQPTARTPVESMSKWSGGENLTASLILFLVLARLRSEQRTGRRAGASGGLVALDNPLGKANYLPFLDLQRRVAKVTGAQLVFFTAIADLGAVTAFPRIVAMHKRPSLSRQGVAFAIIDPEHSYTADNDPDSKPAAVAATTSVRADP